MRCQLELGGDVAPEEMAFGKNVEGDTPKAAFDVSRASGGIQSPECEPNADGSYSIYGLVQVTNSVVNGSAPADLKESNLGADIPIHSVKLSNCGQ